MEKRDQAYWNENCEGDGVGCLGCRHWGGDGLCFFEIDQTQEETKKRT